MRQMQSLSLGMGGLCFDIFSGFDSANGTLLGFGGFLWFMSFILTTIIIVKYWGSMANKAILFMGLLYIVYGLTLRSYSNVLAGFCLMGAGLFFMVFIMNVSGLIPYVFSVTSHLMITLSFSLPIWFTLILSGIMVDSKSVLSHLVIFGSPEVLMMFLVLVESVSICIRPITLSVRLIANMSAGHVVLGLLGVSVSGYLLFGSLIVLLLALLIGAFYFIFEFGVSLIQSYVFSLLCILYSDDHPVVDVCEY